MNCYSYLKCAFDAESEQGVAQAILRGLIDFKRDPWPNISESAKSLVRQMLEPDPKLRLTAKQVLGSKISSVLCLGELVYVSWEGAGWGLGVRRRVVIAFDDSI